MTPMTSSAQLRSAFLDYFARHGHRVVASSPLVPGNDPSLLFTNAGMVQFKDLFLGVEQRDYARAVTSQRCLRAGGKHNDLDQVGYTARHHTFFEMLGNFSFGDYFKRDAVRYAWEFLTEVLKLPAERLWVTIYQDDDEAFAIWTGDIGLAPERVIRIGDNKGAPYASDNFWQMADTGPCGPCSEIFFDHGPDIAGGLPGTAEEDGDRYIEIWNLVFMQFDRAADGTLRPLPAPCVDTGMGLERLAAVLQGVHSNYEIDLFQSLLKAAREATGASDADSPSLRVLADHIRACAFLIVDGVLPGNEGRGYVLRRIIRRAVRHGYKLGQKQPFFHQLVAALAAEMGDAYPELRAKSTWVSDVLLQEEQRFAETVEHGMRLFEQLIGGLVGQRIDGADAFRLYDTYGFPLDLTQDMARERGLTVDTEGFELAMSEQRARARAASEFRSGDALPAELLQRLAPTRFNGYEQLTMDGCEVLALLRDGQSLQLAAGAEQVIVVLDCSPFYAESGGQVGDQGTLHGPSGQARVLDTIKLGVQHQGHVIELQHGELRVGDRLRAEVDAERRSATVLNHSATHLLHAALRKVLGPHVTQKGSLVAPERLRFDFSHFRPMRDEELQTVEDLVNAEIRANADAEAREMGFDEALAAGAMALFGEKYGDRVRVLSLGGFSVELCGGTHVSAAGDIGLFKLISETGVASGVRRIEAVTGRTALEHVSAQQRSLRELAELVRAPADAVPDRVRQLIERSRRLEKELEALRGKLASRDGDELAAATVDIDGVQLLVQEVAESDPKRLRDLVDQLKNKLGDKALVVLAGRSQDKVAIVVGSGAAINQRLPAGPLANHVASRIGGKGGGRADMAQAGGSDLAALAAALASVADWVRERICNTA